MRRRENRTDNSANCEWVGFEGSPCSGVIYTMNKIIGSGIKVLSMYPISTSSYGVTCFTTSLGFSLFTGQVEITPS